MTIKSREATSARESIWKTGGNIGISYLQTINQIIEEIILEDESEINKIKQELSTLSEGSLHVRKKAGSFTFGCANKKSGVETGITGDTQRVHALARRSILEIREKELENRKNRLKRISNSCEEAQYEYRLMQKLGRYSDAGLDLCQILFTKEQNEWINTMYVPNPFHLDSLKWQTDGGIYMRSKSETFIGNGLEKIGWPYRSDDLVIIKGGKPYRDSYYADFKVPNLLGGITVHEHLGSFNLETYGDNALRRLNDYRNFRVEELPGRAVEDYEFTWSFEGDLRTKKGIKRVVQRILLPKFFA